MWHTTINHTHTEANENHKITRASNQQLSDTVMQLCQCKLGNQSVSVNAVNILPSLIINSRKCAHTVQDHISPAKCFLTIRPLKIFYWTTTTWYWLWTGSSSPHQVISQFVSTYLLDPVVLCFFYCTININIVKTHTPLASTFLICHHPSHCWPVHNNVVNVLTAHDANKVWNGVLTG